MSSQIKYQIPTEYGGHVMRSLEKEVFDLLPRNAVNVDVVVDEYLKSLSDEIIFRRVYRIDQIKDNQLTGKPYRMFYLRESADGADTLEFGYTPLIEAHRLLGFLYYQAIGVLTQVRTGFVLKNEIVEIPIVVNETKELGMFMEIGNSVGPISHLHSVLNKLKTTIGLREEWLEPTSYKELLIEESHAD